MSKIVLFLPPYSGTPLGPPAGLLSLASTLLSRGYEVRVIDSAISPDYLGAVENAIAHALCLGVSLLTGPMIEGAILAAKLVKQRRPDMPVIFGGWHPSLLPEQTLREEYVDIVVRNQGERTLEEIVRRLESGAAPAGIEGCSYKEQGRIVHNPDRPATRIASLPMPAYELADFDAYEAVSGDRKLPYASSVGCPYACNYCTDTVFYNRRFNALPASRVVEEITALATRHRLREVALLDSNFLVDTRRAVAIARGFLEAGAKLSWTFQASTDLLCRLSDEEVCLLGSSGLTHIGFGVESGSESILQKMNKKHEHIRDMIESARKCQLAGIRATFNLIFGYPGETERHRQETLRIMGEIGAVYSNVTFSPNIFTPYPGIPAWEELRELGVVEPPSLREWKEFALGTNVLPWLQGVDLRNIQRSMSFFQLNNKISKAKRKPSLHPFLRAGLAAVQKPLQWRMKHHCFEMPIELWILGVQRRLTMRRSLLTGQALGHSLGEAC